MMSPRRASRGQLLCGVTGLCALLAGLGAGPAEAAAPTPFAIPAQPMDSALVAFALQAKLSLGGVRGAACGRLSARVDGLMTSSKALDQLLAGTRCTFVFVDASTVRISFRPPAKPAITTTSTAHLEPVAASPSDLPEVVVTASKRATPIQQTPYAVTAVSGANLALSGSGSLGDIAGQVAGLTLTNLGSGRDKIFIRGLSDGAFTGLTQSTVGLYLDDVPITYSAPDPDLLLTDVEQVEVVRGPQGTLYGSGSMGGIVRITTRKPDLNHFGGSLSDGVAATEHGRPSHLAQVVMNLPLVRGVVAVRGLAYEQVSGGYIDDIGLGLNDVNRTRRAGGRLAVIVQPRQDLTLTAGITHQSINAADTQYAQETLAPLQRSKRLREPHDNDFDQAYATLKTSGAWGDAKISAAYVNHDLLSRYDASGSFRAFNPAPTSAVAFDERERVDLKVVEANLSSPADRRVTWLLGAFFSDSLQKDNSTAKALAISEIFYRADRTDRLTETALYGEASYAMTSRLKLTGGLRWFGSKLSAHTSSAELDVMSRFDGRVHNADISPKLVASYGGGNWLAYVQVSQGYRSGGVNGEPYNPLTAPFPRFFRPDQLWNYETGATAKLLNGKLRLRSAVFHADWSDIQSDQYLPSGLPITLNIGQGSNTGMEIEADINPSDSLHLHGSLLWNDPQLTRVRAAFPARTDQGLPAVPSIAGGLSVSYRWRFSSGLQAQISAETDYIGRSFLTFDGGRNTREGGYAVGNLAGSLNRGPWRLDAYIENLTDETSNTFAHGNPFTRPSAAQTTPLRPRTTGVQLTWSF